METACKGRTVPSVRLPGKLLSRCSNLESSCKPRRGAGLVEITVAVSVMLVLMTVAIPIYRSTRSSAHDAVAQASIAVVAHQAQSLVLPELPPSSEEFAYSLSAGEASVDIDTTPSQDPKHVSAARQSSQIYVLAARSESGRCLVAVGDVLGGVRYGTHHGDSCDPAGVDAVALLAGEGSHEPVEATTTTTTPPPSTATTAPPTTTTTEPPVVTNPYEGLNIYATGAPSCNASIAIDTADRHIEGALHSNGSIQSNGSAGWIAGPVTYVDSVNAWPPSQFVGGISQAAPLDIEAPWKLSEYAPGSAKASAAGDNFHYWNGGMNTSVDGIEPGLHYVAGNVNIWPGASSNVILEEVTIVATGSIQISAASITLTPWDPDGIVLYGDSGGTPTCWNNAIQLSTTSLSWEGVLFAPNGKVGLYTANSTTVAGAIIAVTAQITGNSLAMSLP